MNDFTWTMVRSRNATKTSLASIEYAVTHDGETYEVTISRDLSGVRYAAINGSDVFGDHSYAEWPTLAAAKQAVEDEILELEAFEFSVTCRRNQNGWWLTIKGLNDEQEQALRKLLHDDVLDLTLGVEA